MELVAPTPNRLFSCLEEIKGAENVSITLEVPSQWCSSVVLLLRGESTSAGESEPLSRQPVQPHFDGAKPRECRHGVHAGKTYLTWEVLNFHRCDCIRHYSSVGRIGLAVLLPTNSSVTPLSSWPSLQHNFPQRIPQAHVHAQPVPRPLKQYPKKRQHVSCPAPSFLANADKPARRSLATSPPGTTTPLLSVTVATNAPSGV